MTAKAKPGNYWMRVTVDTSLWTQFESNVLDPQGKGIIHYSNVPLKEPTSRDTSKNLLDPYSIKPFDTSLQPPPSTVDVRVMFLIVPNENDESRAYVQVDGDFDYNQYVEVHEPVLFSTARGLPVNNSANLVRIQKGDVVDLTIYNDDAMPHTFHLHGHNFWVMRHGHTINLQNGKPGNPKELLSKRGFNQEEDLENLYPIHDSIEVPPCVIKNANAGEGGICGGTKGYIVLRYIADNPGSWLCKRVF